MQFDFSHMHIIHAPTAPAGRGGPGSGQAHGTPHAVAAPNIDGPLPTSRHTDPNGDFPRPA